MARTVSLFVSYADKDARPVQRLIDLLTPHFNASRANRYAVWEFRRLLLGEDFHERIQEEIGICDFGLLCISPSFLASPYITRHELPHFAGGGGGKPVLPVGLKPVDFDLHDMKGLDRLQIFMHKKKFFSQPPGDGREAFAFELFRQIESRLAGVKP